ncbi:MAG: hypothetical protein GY802_23255 [Gammaproteobacteria bacterium]|nr:hypothetical protein [Gammaproteobacteria bacterium]
MSTDKDTWDKWDILLRPVGGMLTALSVALVGILGSQYLAGEQANDANTRLYTELMSSRERSDSALRQEMFSVIITTFLKKDVQGNRNVRDEILALELLAYNFHDAIDIGPLFNHVRANIAQLQNATEDELLRLSKRLERVAKEVTGKQLASLEDGGVRIDAYVTFDDINNTQRNEAVTAVKEALLIPGSHEGGQQVPSRKFYLDVLGVDEKKKTLDVQLEVIVEDSGETELAVNFEVGFYDFPMIDNSRLPGGQRVAVALRDWEPGSHVQVALAYFPSSRASLKEKLFYEEIVEQLQSTRAQFISD